MFRHIFFTFYSFSLYTIIFQLIKAFAKLNTSPPLKKLLAKCLILILKTKSLVTPDSSTDELSHP